MAGPMPVLLCIQASAGHPDVCPDPGLIVTGHLSVIALSGPKSHRVTGLHGSCWLYEIESVSAAPLRSSEPFTSSGAFTCRTVQPGLPGCSPACSLAGLA